MRPTRSCCTVRGVCSARTAWHFEKLLLCVRSSDNFTAKGSVVAQHVVIPCTPHVACTTQKIILLRISLPSLGRDTPLQGHSGPGTLWGWAVQGDWGWALQGDSGAGTLWGWALRLGTPGRHSRWALRTLQGHSRVGHSRDTLGLGTPGMSEE